ncbi:MAG: hypothetical protein CL506_00875 [Actinobacteria bacterium]|nr:hypothetical protein [Actinomycetota bacterium]
MRFYYRKILGAFYLILSLIWVVYKGIGSLGLGDIFIAITLVIIGMSIMRYKKPQSKKPDTKTEL